MVSTQQPYVLPPPLSASMLAQEKGVNVDPTYFSHSFVWGQHIYIFYDRQSSMNQMFEERIFLDC